VERNSYKLQRQKAGGPSGVPSYKALTEKKFLCGATLCRHHDLAAWSV